MADFDTTRALCDPGPVGRDLRKEFEMAKTKTKPRAKPKAKTKFKRATTRRTIRKAA